MDIKLIPAKINRCYKFKNENAYIYSQVRSTLGVALQPFQIPFTFDVNKEALVNKKGKKVTLEDRYGLKMKNLERNNIQDGHLIIAQLSLEIQHWSLLIYFNSKVYLYHTKDWLGQTKQTVLYTVNRLFRRYPVEVVTHNYHQKDDMACGAFIICAAIEIVRCLTE